VANNRFREDLLYRLNTVEIRLPPLRERREDIPVLAGHFLRTHAQRYQKSVSGFDEEAMAWLLANSWRGNVREINHIIERAVILASGEVIGMADLAPSDGRMAMPQLEDLTLEQVEEVLIRKALARANGNVTLAAHTLGVSRSALYRRLQSYGI
jgi:DNA-binding NtrC family response regulator